MKMRSFMLVLLTAMFICVGQLWAAFCAKCGDRVREDSKFCSKCGHEVGKPVGKEKKAKRKPLVRPKLNLESIEEADNYYDLAHKEQYSIGSLVLPNIKRKRYEKALALYLKIIEKWPNSDKAELSAYNAAGIYGSILFRKWEKSIRYYRLVLKMNPETTLDARLQIARVTELRIHDYEGAIPLYEDVIANARVQNEKERAAKAIRKLRIKLEKSQKKLEK